MMELTQSLAKIGAFLLFGVGIAAGFLRPSALWRLSTNTLSNKRKVVCVVGGGFGGLYSALYIALRSDPDTDVYLVDPKKHFTVTPLLYELAVGTAKSVEVFPQYSDLFATSKIRYICGTVMSIDIPNHQCKILLKSEGRDATQQQLLCFDELVIAAGIQPRVDMVQGAEDFALPFYSASDAVKLKAKLTQLRAEVRVNIVNVVVIGGGYGGVEVAANIAENLGGKKSLVTIVDRNARLMTTSSDFNRRTAERALKQRGVSLRFNTSVQRVSATSVQLTDRLTGDTFDLPANLVVLTAGTQQTPLMRSLDLQKDAQGKILTRRTLQCVEHDHIYALGDCAAVQDASNPATAQVAMQQALTLASNVLESLRFARQVEALSAPSSEATETASGPEPSKDIAHPSSSFVATPSTTSNSATNKPKLREFTFFSLGEMISLGDTHASMTSLGGWVNLSGPLAAMARRAVYAVRMPTLKQTWVALRSAIMTTTNKVLFGRSVEEEL